MNGSLSYRDWWRELSILQRLGPALAISSFWTLHLLNNGLRPEHILIGIVPALFYGGPKTLRWFDFLLPLALFLAVYDSQNYYVASLRGPIRVEEPFNFDLKYFGIATPEGVLLPTQWWQRHAHPLLDVLTAFPYILFVPIFLAVVFRIQVHYGRAGSLTHAPEVFRQKAYAMLWAMFWTALVSCVTYFVYPAAPPWYVDLYGFGPVNPMAPASPAGAGRVDALLGIPIFATFYGKSPNVFGAIPSMHVAFPFIALYFSLRLRVLRIFCAIFFSVIAFGAVYLNHHYIVDILLGILYALIISIVMDVRSAKGT